MWNAYGFAVQVEQRPPACAVFSILVMPEGDGWFGLPAAAATVIIYYN